MLVLSRKLGEQIMIGSNIQLTVVDIQGPRVRLGLIAPPDVAIRRQELPPRAEDSGTKKSLHSSIVSGSNRIT